MIDRSESHLIAQESRNRGAQARGEPKHAARRLLRQPQPTKSVPPQR